MSTQVHDHAEPSLASLVTGIASDMQDLVKQQLQLTRHEIEEDLRKSKEAVAMLVLGIAVVFLGAILLCLGLAHLINWATLPAGMAPPGFPLWACFGVVGAVLALGGGCLMAMGRSKFQQIHPIDNPATEALKENVEWATRPK